MEKAVDMPAAEAEKDNSQFVKNSVLYKEFLAEREEMLKHKWIESEKAGKVIGFEKALLDWIVKRRCQDRHRDRHHRRSDAPRRRRHARRVADGARIETAAAARA